VLDEAVFVRYKDPVRTAQ